MFETKKVHVQESLEQMQVPYGRGPGVRRSKRPLLASRTGYKCPMETSRNKVITEKWKDLTQSYDKIPYTDKKSKKQRDNTQTFKTAIRSSSVNTVTIWWNVWSMEGVTVHMTMSQNVTHF